MSRSQIRRWNLGRREVGVSFLALCGRNKNSPPAFVRRLTISSLSCCFSKWGCSVHSTRLPVIACRYNMCYMVGYDAVGSVGAKSKNQLFGRKTSKHERKFLVSSFMLGRSCTADGTQSMSG